MTSVWFHIVAWFLMVSHGSVWFCMVSHSLAWSGMVALSFAWFCVVLHGFAWFCVVLRGFAWFRVVTLDECYLEKIFFGPDFGSHTFWTKLHNWSEKANSSSLFFWVWIYSVDRKSCFFPNSFSCRLLGFTKEQESVKNFPSNGLHFNFREIHRVLKMRK